VGLRSPLTDLRGPRREPGLTKDEGIETNVQSVTVVGQGYVGLAASVAVASAGYTVHAAESDPRRLAALREGRSYIPDVSSAAIREAMARGRFHPVADARDAPPADVYLIATPTPVTEENLPDLSLLDTALESIAPTVRPGALVVLESTVYPGALRQYVAPRLTELSGLRAGAEVHLAYSPERVDPGRGRSLGGIAKLVSGLDERSGKLARAFYETVFSSVVEVSSSEVAEFAKLFENTFRYVNIAFVNELSKAAHAMNIPFREVVAAASTKGFGFMPFHHGPGAGGHCLPNNVHYLNHALRQAGFPSSLLEAAEDINRSMPEYAVERLRELLEGRNIPLNRSRILLLGLAFKAGVADVRNSPARDIGDLLATAGAQVRVADPWVPPEEVAAPLVAVELTAQECAAADAVVLATDHEEADYQLVLDSARLILDCRGRLRSREVVQL